MYKQKLDNRHSTHKSKKFQKQHESIPSYVTYSDHYGSRRDTLFLTCNIILSILVAHLLCKRNTVGILAAATPRVNAQGTPGVHGNILIILIGATFTAYIHVRAMIAYRKKRKANKENKVENRTIVKWQDGHCIY